MSMPGSINALGKALVEFTTDGAFPEEEVSALKLNSEALPSAIDALSQAKSQLEAEIHTINEETAGDVATWKAKAASLQADILRSRQTANDILRQASEPAVSGEATAEAAERVGFLKAELTYNARVREALVAIKDVNNVLDQAEQACRDQHIVEALKLLDKAWKALDALPVGLGIKALRLLDVRAIELKETVHNVFEQVWQGLIQVDAHQKRVSIQQTAEDNHMTITDAATALDLFEETNQRMAHLWHGIDSAIICHRMDVHSARVPAVMVKDGVLQVEGSADRTIDALFSDLNIIFSYLDERLPPGLIESMSTLMMPEISSRIISQWLDPAVPPSLKDMEAFENIMAAAKSFCRQLRNSHFLGFNELQDWVEDAPKVWLTKCRETALDMVRTQLLGGLGAPKSVERIEKQMISQAEGQELAAAAEEDDWGAAWDDQGDQPQDQALPPNTKQILKPAEDLDEDAADAWGAWADEGDEEKTAEPEAPAPAQESNDDDDDDAGDAWGWNDDDANEEPETAAQPQLQTQQQGSGAIPAGQRELTLKETYNISAMPDPVLELIFAIIEDGALLSETEHQGSLVAKAAAGLFTLPTLALAMFRAVGPYYYALAAGGNMFLYNDSTYLAEKLTDFTATWKTRDNLTAQAQRSLRLDNDISMLQSFATRAYSNEMSIQKTVLRDLLGGHIKINPSHKTQTGEQSLLIQDDLDSCVDGAIARVRSLAATWESILARSAWRQAVGSLVDTISLKIISDVMEAPSIGQEDAYSIAKQIATVTELDDLFLTSRAAMTRGTPAGAEHEMHPTTEAPATMQYAPSWMRLKYLSEVLQSNLQDVRFLWLEGELSLFFGVDEVVDLINLSFEDNPRTRQVLKEITGNPHPRREEHEQQHAW
ncbi:hypothetical protein BD289DRAFT_402349 [Coniella lustricola]|uniref:ZW10 C-terminal helical domain-containing protein n=1 Tax=Coniella lustricola TaxID=2025994 RepID=A0A2T3AJT8_9PEZI|nr:hypothetical protein BD289DRAFT_402349 [Coniella lustricola]